MTFNEITALIMIVSGFARMIYGVGKQNHHQEITGTLWMMWGMML